MAEIQEIPQQMSVRDVLNDVALDFPHTFEQERLKEFMRVVTGAVDETKFIDESTATHLETEANLFIDYGDDDALQRVTDLLNREEE